MHTVDEQLRCTWKHLTFWPAAAPCLEIKKLFVMLPPLALKTQICPPATDLTLAVAAAEERVVGAGAMVAVVVDVLPLPLAIAVVIGWD